MNFTVTYNEIIEELYTVIEIESALDPGKRIKIKAIWDTGAVFTTITPRVAKELNMEPVSATTISSITDKNIFSLIYMVNLYMPDNTKYESFVKETNPTHCDILIGMDIIQKGDFAVSNFNGKTTFSFRLPSQSVLDFNVHSYSKPIRNEMYIGRNDPCPCGSGKKYKYCCSKNIGKSNQK